MADIDQIAQRLSDLIQSFNLLVENSKKIPELDASATIEDDNTIAISINGQTRKITVQQLREFFENEQSLEDVVRYTEQSKGEGLQAQARENIGIKTIIVSNQMFYWHPYPRADYDSVEVGDVASNGWGGQNRFVKYMIFTGGDATDINNWNIESEI